MSGGGVPTDCPGVTFDTVITKASAGAIDTLLIPGGSGVFEALKDPTLVDAARTLSGGANRLATVCVGAFVAAEAGLLDDRKVVTHWRACDRLARCYPALRVDSDAIWVRDGHVWSSAGVSAGVDLALAMIEADLGSAVALAVARELVVFLKRPGGQTQYSTTLKAQLHAADGRFAELVTWIANHLATDMRAERLAERAGMSLRSFTRYFPAELGETPARYVEYLRTERARHLVETTDLRFDAIAGQCGLHDAQALRRVLKHRFRADPATLRARFGAARSGT